MRLTVNKKIVSIAFLVLALFMLLAVSYAYFTATVEGNEEAKEINVTAGIMSVKLTGPNEITAEHLIPGQSVSISFQVENTGTVPAIYNLDMIEVKNNFEPTSDLVYTITSTNNGGHVQDKEAPIKNETLIRNILIQPGEENIQEYTLTLLFKETKVNQDTNQNKTFEGRVQINNSKNDLFAARILTINSVQTEEPDFSHASPEKNSKEDYGTGLFVSEDDDGISYYFRGAVENNNVHFADMDWKIIRINGDGTIRLIYSNGQTISSVGESSFTNYSWAPRSHAGRFTGYTYDNELGKECTHDHPCEVIYDGTSFLNQFGGTNSDIKTFLEEWYNKNLNEDDDKVALGFFCNDVSYGGGIENAVMNDDDFLYYGSYERIAIEQAPSLKCPNPTDKDGNLRTYGGIYKTKIGLITADEMNMGGLSNGSRKQQLQESNYLYYSNDWWSISPFKSDNRISTYISNNIGQITTGYSYWNDPYHVIPVINLKADVTFTGDGTKDNPYTIE